MSTFTETWKGIAAVVNRSERWCRYMAQRRNDPLPTYKVGGVVRMDMPELEAWLLRQHAQVSELHAPTCVRCVSARLM